MQGVVKRSRCIILAPARGVLHRRIVIVYCRGHGPGMGWQDHEGEGAKGRLLERSEMIKSWKRDVDWRQEKAHHDYSCCVVGVRPECIQKDEQVLIFSMQSSPDRNPDVSFDRESVRKAKAVGSSLVEMSHDRYALQLLLATAYHPQY